MSEPRLSHLDSEGTARMVDVSGKDESERVAVAEGRVRCDPQTVRLVEAGLASKGDVLGVARIAGVQAAKRTAELIPLCHPLPITHVEVDVSCDAAAGAFRIRASVRTVGRTGVEMEALTAVAVAGLTVIDMIKSTDRWASLEAVGMTSKHGGKSGDVERPPERAL